MNTTVRLRLSSLVRAALFAACAASPLANAAPHGPPPAPRHTVYAVKLIFPSTLQGPGVTAFNNVGQFVGARFYPDPRFSRAAIWNGKDATEWTIFGEQGTVPLGINDAGTIAGRALQFLDQRNSWRAVIWRGSAITFLKTLGGDYGEASSINNAGHIVGTTSTGRENHATLWKDGRVIDLGTLGGGFSAAIRIKDTGDIVGSSSTAAPDTSYATLWKKGRIHKLGSLGGNRSEAADVNRKGQVVGWSNLAGNETYHAFLWEHGKMKDLGTLGGTQSSASAIDDAGTVFGFSLDAEGKARGVLWRGSRIVDLNTLLDPAATGVTIINAVGVNDRGEVLAIGSTPGGPGYILLAPRRRK